VAKAKAAAGKGPGKASAVHLPPRRADETPTTPPPTKRAESKRLRFRNNGTDWVYFVDGPIEHPIVRSVAPGQTFEVHPHAIGEDGKVVDAPEWFVRDDT